MTQSPAEYQAARRSGERAKLEAIHQRLIAIEESLLRIEALLETKLPEGVTQYRRLRPCQHCGGLFEAGAGAKRRADARFCCDEHRITHNSLSRSLRP